MATLPPPASPFDPVLEIEHGTIDGKACVNAFYVAISEKSYEADDSGPGATPDKVLLATVTEAALRMLLLPVRQLIPMAQQALLFMFSKLPVRQ